MRDIARQTIQDIIITGTITRSSISLLEDAVSVISQAEWGDISDELGLTLGLEDPAYNRELIYLCTLHALLVPKFLTKFLLWIAEGPEYAYQMSITLQGSLRFIDSDVLQHFPNLKKRLESGVRFLFYRLVYKQAELLHPAIKLLTSDWGLWSHSYQTLVAEELKSYLRHMNPHADVDFSFESVSSPLFQEVLADIYRFWDDETEPNLDSRYHPLAVVFEETQQPHLAAIFYQISQGYVPKAVVDRLSVVRLPPRLYGLILQPEAGSSFQKADPSTLTPPPSNAIANPPEVDIFDKVILEPETEDPSLDEEVVIPATTENSSPEESSLDEEVVIPATTENSSPEESSLDEEVVIPAITEDPPVNVKPAPPEPTLPPKTALKRMMQRGKVSLDLISSLEYAIPETSKSEWLEMTDALGATTAMTQGIYTDQIVRLYTLKSIVLPNFLPDFLNWLHQSKNADSYYRASFELQAKICEEISNIRYEFSVIEGQIEQGLCIVISHLVQEPKILNEACLLLESSGFGLWSTLYRKSLYHKLENDLSLMRRHVYGQKNLLFQAIEYPEWKSLLAGLISIWQVPNITKPKYLPLAKLFEEAKTLKLAAFFYQVSKGEIPKFLFFKVSRREWQDQLFGITINRGFCLGVLPVNILGIGINKSKFYIKKLAKNKFLPREVNTFLFKIVSIGGIQMTRLTAALLFALFFVMGGIGGFIISARSTDQVVEEETQEIQEKLTKKEQEIESWQVFQQHIIRTQPALEQLQENLRFNLDMFIRRRSQRLPAFVIADREGVFIHFLKETLAPDEVPYEIILYSLVFQEKEYGDIFIRAVKYYQERNGLPPNGIIDPGGATSQQLEADMRERLR